MNHYKLAKGLLLILGILFFQANTYAKKIPTVTSAVVLNPMNTTPAPPFPYVVSSIQDPRYGDYSSSTWSTNFSNQSIKNIVRLKIDRSGNKYISHKGKIVVNFDVKTITVPSTYWSTTPSFDPIHSYTKELVYDTSLNAKEKDEIVVVIADAVWSEITVQNVQYYDNGTLLTTIYANGYPDISIQNTIEIERTEKLITSSSPGATNIHTCKPNSNSKDQFIALSWPAWTGAEAYELEYLFVNYNSTNPNTALFTGAVSLTAYPYNFRNNCTRVLITTGTTDTLPNLFPEGYLLFRYRAVGRKVSDPSAFVYGDWSIAESGTANLTATPPLATYALHTVNMNPDLNWSFSMAFAEESKKGVSITYFDGTLRAREGTAFSHSTGLYTVSQTVLDYLGREALVAMPAIALDNMGFQFRPKFNQNLSGAQYSYFDFDLNKTSSDELQVSPMKNTTGANGYFSSNFLSSSVYSSLDPAAQRMHTFLPDAGGYAFSQVEFTRDPSGRTWRQGGVGKTHQLKAFDPSGSWVNGKQTLTYDGTPNQAELDILFGNEIGYAEKYKKIMTQDPNGQLSVAYMDPYGRTVATALAGTSENTPNLDALASSGHKLTLSTSIPNTLNNKFEGKKVISHTFLVTSRDTWKFWYTFDKPKFSLCDSSLCLECAYDLTIDITNPNNYDRSLFIGGPITMHVGSPVGDTNYCSTTQQFTTNPSPIKVLLDPGEYRLTKILSINHTYKDSLREQWLQASRCVKSLKDFIDEEKNKIGNSCILTCDDCDDARASLQHDIDSVVSWCGAHSVDYHTYTPYLTLLDEQTELTQVCNEACNEKTPCETLLDAITADMQPGGQYAKYMDIDASGNDVSLSSIAESTIFKSSPSWWCSAASTSYPIWRQPHNPDLISTDPLLNVYLNADGTEALIPITEIDGVETPAYTSSVTISGVKYVHPQDLANVDDFIEYYKNHLDWARSLVYYHPEYCQYTKCKLVEPLYRYDQMILEVDHAATAKRLGFYNPLNMSAGPVSSGGMGVMPGTGSNISYSLGAGVTPYLDSAYIITLPAGLSLSDVGSGSSTVWGLRSKLLTFSRCSTSTASIWEIMEKMRYDQNLTAFDSCVEDLFWPVLRGMYLAKKHEWLDQWYKSSSGCPGGSACSTSTGGIKVPRWQYNNTDELVNSTALPNNSWFKPSRWSGVDFCNETDAKSRIDGQIADHCDTICRAHVEEWMRKLDNCFTVNAYLGTLTSTARATVLANIKADLLNVCKGGCDLDNPYGSTNVSQDNLTNHSSTYPDKDVAAVLEKYLHPTGSGAAPYFSAGICDDLIIDFPYEYGHDYQAYNGPNMDTCACSKDKNIRQDINERCPPYGADSLKVSDCACDKTASLKYPLLELKGVDNDKSCQNCITCKELELPVRLFLQRYDVVNMSDTPAVQQLLTTWLNRSFGFNLTYLHYWGFATSCVDTVPIGSWYKLWQRVGIERLVAWNGSVRTTRSATGGLSLPENPSNDWGNTAFLYHPPANLYATTSRNENDVRTTRELSLHPRLDDWNYWVSVYNSSMLPALPMAPESIQSAAGDNIICHCRKLLAAAKLYADGSSYYADEKAAYIQLYGSWPFGTTSFSLLHDKCAEIYTASSPADPAKLKKFRIDAPFSTAAKDYTEGLLSPPPPPGDPLQILKDNTCTSADPEVPCMKRVDTCGCNKLYDFYHAWMNDGTNGYGHHSLEVYIKNYFTPSTGGVTVSNAEYMYGKCLEMFMKGVEEDDHGNKLRPFNHTVAQGWWSTDAQSNLFNESRNFSNEMQIPAAWSCDNDCDHTDNSPDKTPCPLVVTPCDLHDFLYWYILQNWFTPTTGGQKQYEKMGTTTHKGVDAYLAELLSWTDQYAAYLDGTLTPSDPVTQARVDFLNAMLTKLQEYYNMHTCSPYKTYNVEFFLKLMLSCGNGNIGSQTYCEATRPDCSQLGTRLHSLMATHTWPAYTDPGYSDYSGYAKDFLTWYYEWTSRKANGTNTTADDDWLTAVANDLNATYNTCEGKTFSVLYFLKRVQECMPLPAGPRPDPCPECYGPDTAYMNALQGFFNQVTKKNSPDRLTNLKWYLKKQSSTDPNLLTTTFYNTILYQGGSDIDHLTWNLDQKYENGDLLPGIKVTVKDNNSFRMTFSLDWPTNEERWNFNYIQKFINIKAIKTENCDKPKYFAIQAVYKVPYKYVSPESDQYGYHNNYPTSAPTYCLDTVTLIGKLWESTNNQGIAKKVPCLGCNKLCNIPMGDIAYETMDPCQEELQTAVYNGMVKYGMHLQAMRAWFDSVYREKCFGAKDSLWLKYPLHQYHYTLYYYDQAGQLIKTVPPAGVDIDNNSLSDVQRQQLADDRCVTARKHRTSSSAKAKMYHSLITNYRYYTGGQLAWQHTPDGGESRFWYDALGRLSLSQNAKQLDNTKYSFTRYDALGRPYIAGELAPGSQSFTVDDYHLALDLASPSSTDFTDDGILIQSGTGNSTNGLVYYDGLNRRLKIPMVPDVTKPNIKAQCGNFGLTPGQSYTLRFQDWFMSTLNTLTYTITSNLGTITTGTITTGGWQSISFTVPSASTGVVSVIFSSTVTLSTDYFEIDDINIRHSASGVQVPCPRYAAIGTAISGWIPDFVDAGTKAEVVQTWYDAIPSGCSSEFTTVLTSGQGNNMRNRVAFTSYEDVYDANDATYNHATAYSYDIHGNAEKVVQNIPSLKHMGVNLYTLDYNYDLLSGKVNSVSYQLNKPDQWLHRYEYDPDNRLVRAYTSRDGYIWERDAKYFYYLHGPLGRTELGQLQVQGIDNAYTLHGWLKGVNGPDMTQVNDIGQDGYIPATGTGTNQFVARDAFAYYLSYYGGDFSSIATSPNTFEPLRIGSDLQSQYRDLYNGNIAHMGTLIPKIGGTGGWTGNNTKLSRQISADVLGNVYHYDQLNRITKHYVYDNFSASGGGSAWGSTGQSGADKYYETFAYDPNGNITDLYRHGDGTTANPMDMDNMTYNYDSRSQTITLQQTTISMTLPYLYSNKLYHVNDGVSSANYTDDIDDQGAFTSTPSSINTANNYGYDKLGNLVRDTKEEIATIEWTVTGKIKKVTRTSTSKKADLVYGYDASGTRLFKVVIPKVQSGAQTGHVRHQETWDTTWYMKDASGNPMATYKIKHKRKIAPGPPPPPGLPQQTVLLRRFYLDELYIYGVQRHGVLKPDTFYTEEEYGLQVSDYMADSLFPSMMTRTALNQNGLTNYSSGSFEFWRGYKQYELGNHLGNVLVTIQDRKWGLQTATPANVAKADYYLAYVVNVTDYYAFGSGMKLRTASFGIAYRYGFNNQEKEGELGEYYSFEYRVHDSRLGRFLSRDPLSGSMAWQTPFSLNSNDPISRFDPDGRADFYTKDGKYLGTDGVNDNVFYQTTEEVWNSLYQKLDNQGTDWQALYTNQVTTNFTAKYGYTLDDILNLAAIAYNEATTSKDDQNAIANIMINNSKINKESVNTTIGKAGTGSYRTREQIKACHAGYKTFWNSTPTNRNKVKGMMTAIMGAQEAASGTRDASNGATGWEGKDFFISSDPVAQDASLTWARKVVNGIGYWISYITKYVPDGFIWDPNAKTTTTIPSYMKTKAGNSGKKGYKYIGCAYYGGNVYMRMNNSPNYTNPFENSSAQTNQSTPANSSPTNNSDGTAQKSGPGITPLLIDNEKVEPDATAIKKPLLIIKKNN